IIQTDAEDLFHIFSDEETMRYWSCRPYASVDQARGLIESIAEAAQAGVGIHWAITLRGDERLVGTCGYNEWRKAHRRGVLSYIVAGGQRGNVIVGEALGAMLDYGFDHMNLHSVEAGVTPCNDASTRMLQRLGFRLEGHLRENFLTDRGFVDSLVYSLLRSDWESPKDSKADKK